MRINDHEQGLTNQQLLGFILRLLRHSPEQAGLAMEPEGWIEKELLVESLRQVHPQTEQWRVSDLDAFLIEHNSQQRFSFTDTKCRANYGHSSVQYQPKLLQKLPSLLFHATSLELFTWIEEAGIMPMRRRFVQLTESLDYAKQISNSLDQAVILTIKQPRKGRPLMGHPTGSHVWLATHVPPNYIRLDQSEQ